MNHMKARELMSHSQPKITRGSISTPAQIRAQANPLNKHSINTTLPSITTHHESISPAPQAPTTQSLASRMKSYESTFDHTLPLTSPIILRLDGHGFSRFTAHFARPFDQRIHLAMTRTSSDLLSYFPVRHTRLHTIRRNHARLPLRRSNLQLARSETVFHCCKLLFRTL
ncbi:tRNAHis guanylyltransferase [Pyrenophora tritici-repentis]|nr:tRNAHis guanylyltransferase [Pyrenophora tritici-repentis]